MPPGPSIFFLPSAKAGITKLTNETERTMYAAANASVKRHQLKKMMKTASKNFIQFICECFLNVVDGNVAINKKLIETHEKSFQKILSKQTGLKEKERILGS